MSRTVFSALSGMRLLACLIVAPQRGYDEPAILSYAISSFCPTSADGLHDVPCHEEDKWKKCYDLQRAARYKECLKNIGKRKAATPKPKAVSEPPSVLPRSDESGGV